jgi:hypothetical protein
MPRSVAVWGVPRPGPWQPAELLGRWQEVRAWARALGFELTGVPGDLGLLDRAIDQAIGTWGRHSRMSAVGNEAGRFLGTVIVAGVPGARWRLWPNGHPVVRLPGGRDLDVVAVAHDRVDTGTPLLADVYARAAAGHHR